MAVNFAKCLKLRCSNKDTKWAKHTARKKDTDNAYKSLVGRSCGKMPVKRHRIEMKDNTKLILKKQETGNH